MAVTINGDGSISGLTTGKAVQFVQTVISSATSITSNTVETSATGFSAAITPASASNKVLLMCSLFYASRGTTYGAYFKRGSTIIGVGDAAGSRQRVSIGLGFITDTNQSGHIGWHYLDSPSTTSSTTYQLFVINDGNAPIYLNRTEADQNNVIGKRGASTVTLIEVEG
jgi:hypothetical protein